MRLRLGWLSVTWTWIGPRLAAFLGAEGNVAERQAVAKLASAEARFARDVAKAQVNRVRAKMKSYRG
jgi:hypothetical protein